MRVRVKTEDAGKRTVAVIDRKPETIKPPVFSGQQKNKASGTQPAADGSSAEQANKETVKPRKKRRYYYGKKKNGGAKT